MCFTFDKGGGTCFCACLFVCLSVCVQDYSKTRAWIWMKCCVSTDVGTWTNWLTFEPDRDHSPDAGTGLLSPIHCNAEFYYVGKIRIRIGRASQQRRVVLLFSRMHCIVEFYYVGKIPRTGIGRPSKQRRVVLRRRNTVVGGKCALPSALLVYLLFFLPFTVNKVIYYFI